MHACAAACITSVLAGVLVVALMRESRHRIACIGILGCCTGVLLAASATANLQVHMMAVQDLGATEMVLQVVEDSKDGDYGASCIAIARLLDGQRVRVRVNLPEGIDANCWQRIQAHAAISAPGETSAQYYWRKSCVGSVTLDDVELLDPTGPIGAVFRLRDRGIRTLDNLPPGFRKGNDKGIALLEAILFGSRRELFASDFYRDVKVAGLAHMVAVSGAHLVIISGFFVAMLRAMRFPKAVCILLQGAFVIAYVAFTGMPVSAMRAAIMSLCALSSHFARRRSSSLTALGLCVMAMVGLDPFMAVSVSLALSCLASLGIVLFSHPIDEWIDGFLGGRCRFVSKTLAATIAANALTLGVSAAVFAQVPLISPLSNLLAVPVFTVLVCAGMACAALGAIVPSVGVVLMLPVAMIAQVFCDVVGVIACIPFACVPADIDLGVAVVVTIAALLAYLRFVRAGMIQLSGKALAAGLIAVVAAYAILPRAHGAEIIMLDVGQGDAVAYRKGNRVVLVDTGTNDSQVLAALARHDIRSLDAVIISHPDDDHCGSLQAISDIVPIGTVCVAADLMECECQNCEKLRSDTNGMDMTPLNVGDEVEFAGFHMTVIAPEAFSDEGGNSDSLVMTVTIDCDGDDIADWSAITSGDAEAEALDRLLDEGRIQHADVLKVAHHGSAGSLNDDLLTAISPRVALIGVGEGNRYGHPSPETLILLNRYGVQTYRSDLDGDVTCILTPNSLTVRASR